MMHPKRMLAGWRAPCPRFFSGNYHSSRLKCDNLHKLENSAQFSNRADWALCILVFPWIIIFSFDFYLIWSPICDWYYLGCAFLLLSPKPWKDVMIWSQSNNQRIHFEHPMKKTNWICFSSSNNEMKFVDEWPGEMLPKGERPFCESLFYFGNREVAVVLNSECWW